MSPKNRHDNRMECFPDCYVPLHVVGTGEKFEAFYTRMITQGPASGAPWKRRVEIAGRPARLSQIARSLASSRARSVPCIAVLLLRVQNSCANFFRCIAAASRRKFQMSEKII